MDEFLYTHVLRAAVETPWAILPAKLAVIQDLLVFRANGGRLSAEEVRERLAEGEEVQGAARGRVVGGQGVAVVPLIGTIMPRGNMLLESSGAVSLQGFRRAFRAAMADPEVGSVVLDVDSPGGQVGGVVETADEIFAARGEKPIIAVANTLMASAAYHIGTAADELVVSPSGEVGSIGVFAMHQDMSVMLDAEGVRVTLISAGRYKTEGNPFEPLSDEARGAIQSLVDDYYDLFVSSVAKYRGVKKAEVKGGFGEGRVVTAREAVQLGMADRVGTFEEVVGELARGRSRRTGRSSAGDFDARRRRLRLAEVGGHGVSVETGD